MSWPAAGAESPGAGDLTQMSLTDLGNLEVTSVSKAPEALHNAAASVYVITHEEIRRSGATSVAAAMRLSPVLLVTQLTASSYTVSARGLAGNPMDQNFSNKLLILIDGRSVYSPLFSGVYYDAEDVMLEDVDRIEVITGPGATLWGANAMNGVINIITRPAYLTDGGTVVGGAGNEEQTLGARIGAHTAGDLAYRVYGKEFHRGSEEQVDGASARDGWSKGQGGFRLDWTLVDDTVTVQGDGYRGTENQLGQGDLLIAGANLTSRWQHRSAASELQVQAYYDQSEREGPGSGDGFVLHTVDLEVQQTLQAAPAHKLVWGAGERVNSYEIGDSASLLFLPTSRALTLGNLFAEDTWSATGSLKFIGGVKLEDDPFSGWTALPDLRVGWQPDGTNFWWASGSRAIRSPTPFDTDVEEKLAGIVFLTGNRGFRPERLTAYEIGYRNEGAASVSISGFFNTYEDLRTVETNPVTGSIPLLWGNSMHGDVYGLEGWAKWPITAWWELNPGVTLLRQHLRFDPGASGLLGIAQAGAGAGTQASLVSSMSFASAWEFDASLHYVSRLGFPSIAGYYEAGARLGWRLSRQWELSLSGENLLHERHLEYSPQLGGEEILRSVLARFRWSF